MTRLVSELPPIGDMSPRDWFAATADQPGVSEIVAAAGYATDGFWVELPHGQERFNDWWNSLPLSERCALYAKVRYALADAMMAERAKRGEGEG